MIIDYKNNKEFALVNGVKPENTYGEAYFSQGKVVNDTTFCNFDHLCVEHTIFENCTFENCNTITFNYCQIKNCSFKNDCRIEGNRTSFYDCHFKECCAEGPFLLVDSYGPVKGCTFETITTLGCQGYIIWSGYGKKHEVEKIVDCKFIDCQTESEDGEFFHCYYFKPFSSFRTVTVDNIDYESCSFKACESKTWTRD